jgi:AbiTii
MTFHEKVAVKLGLSNGSIIREIQRDLLEESVSVSAVLRKARLAAKKLGLKEFSEWIGNEADGYKCSNDALPKYRKVPIAPKFFNPYNGWRPIIIEDPDIYEIYHTGYLFQSIDEIESLGEGDGTLTYGYPHELCSFLRRNMEFDFEIRGFVSTPRLKAVSGAVKNLLLDWAVDLENAGILGEGMGFSNRDKDEAAAVTQTIYAQNIGNLGNMSGKSSVQNTLSGNSFSINDADEYVKHIRAALPGVPDKVRAAIDTELQRIDSARRQKDPTIIQKCLKSIQTICEGAAGSLAAQGIAMYLATIFSQ